MKTLKTIFVAAMSLVAVSVSAQTADDIVNKHIAALGGAEKLSTLKTVKMEGSLNTQGIDVPLTMTKKQGAGLRLDLDIMGTSNFQLANPAKGWVFMPVMGQTEPQEMTTDQLKGVQSQLDIQGTFFNYKEKGYTVEYVATEKVGDKNAYKLKVIKNGDPVTYFIDVVSNFIVKAVSKTNVNGQDVEIETTYTDYKKNAEGFWFPYSQTNTQGTIIYDKIICNIAVDDALFTN